MINGVKPQFHEDVLEKIATQAINALLQNAITAFKAAEKLSRESVRDAERMGRVGHGYLAAANDVLRGHPWLHNELIESRDFMEARKLGRKWSD